MAQQHLPEEAPFVTSASEGEGGPLRDIFTVARIPVAALIPYSSSVIWQTCSSLEEPAQTNAQSPRVATRGTFMFSPHILRSIKYKTS